MGGYRRHSGERESEGQEATLVQPFSEQEIGYDCRENYIEVDYQGCFRSGSIELSLKLEVKTEGICQSEHKEYG